MRPLNIAISSSRQWNPGDEFIGLGVRRVVEAALGARPANWILWDRNPDRFQDPWTNRSVRRSLLANSLWTIPADVIDLVVLAGSPEWKGPPTSPLYDFCHIHRHVPMLALGLGSDGYPVSLTPIEKDVLGRSNTLIVTRCHEAARAIDGSLGQPKAQLKPCPAFFCGDQTELRTSTGRLAVVVQHPEAAGHAISPNLLSQLKNMTNNMRPEDADILAFYYVEFVLWARMNGNLAVRFDFDSTILLEKLQEYDLMIGTRLHGAIAMLSLGRPAFIVADPDNARIAGAAAAFEGLLPVGTPAQAAKWRVGAKKDKATFFTKIMQKKKSLHDEWVTLIRTFLRANMNNLP